MSDDNENDAVDEKLMAEHQTLLDALQDAIEHKDEAGIFIHGQRYLRFISAHDIDLGPVISKEEVESMIAKFDHFGAVAAKEMREMRIEAQHEAEDLIQKFGEKFLWRKLRQISSTPPLLRGTAQYRKVLQEFAPALEIYAQYLSLVPLENVLKHFRTRLDFYKKMRANGEQFALPAEKIDVLAKALDDFQNIYEAEQAEQTEQTGQKELVLSAHEAVRIRKLFDEVDQPAQPPVVRGGN